MARQGSVTLDEVIAVLRDLGGEADTSDIRREIVSRRGNEVLPPQYNSWDSYQKTIDQHIQYHCPQCMKFLGKEVYFEQVHRGRYRLTELTSCGTHATEAPPSNQDASRSQEPCRPDSSNDRLPAVVEEMDVSAFPEGQESYRLHRTRERNQQIVHLAKRKRMVRDDLLRCEVCGFSFQKAYGDIGVGFIEAHHTVPISKLSEDAVTRWTDIALVCSNCHRMLHRYRPWPTLDELRNIIVSTGVDDLY